MSKSPSMHADKAKKKLKISTKLAAKNQLTTRKTSINSPRKKKNKNLN